jgi:ElaB/YqjD/DUF883 family membrane-anchored ribosome-binding protein
MVTKNSNGTVADSQEALAEQVAVLKSDFKDLASTIESVFGAHKDELKNYASKKTDTAVALAGDAATAASKGALQARDTTAEAIRERPLTALAVSAGIGLLIGLMSARRS